MLRNWPVLFIVIPLVELYFIIKVGEFIGAFWTIVLVLLTAFIGVNLLRYQGLNMLARAQRNMAQGTLPAQEMMEGMVLAVGAVLLITPGFITDTLGFLCLIPVTRRTIIRGIISRANIQTHSAFYSANHENSTGSDPQASKEEFIQGHHADRQPGSSTDDKPAKNGRVIDGECRHED